LGFSWGTGSKYNQGAVWATSGEIPPHCPFFIAPREKEVSHYCPVCYKEIPEEAYSQGVFQCCFPLYSLDKNGYACTGWGTIKLGEKPGEFTSIFPKEIFDKQFNRIREMKKVSVRW